MALLVNGARLASGSSRYRGASAAGTGRAQFYANGERRNLYCGDATVIEGVGIATTSATPRGYRPPGAWLLPPTGGGMASINLIVGDATLTADLHGGKLATASLAGTSSLSANGSARAPATAALAGTSTLTGAMVGRGAMVAALAGTSSLTAGLEALARMVAALVGTSTLTAETAAYASMSASIEACSGLTAGEVAAAVWESIAAAYDTPGTMGQLLNDAGAAGNPWNTEIENNYTAEELMRLLSAVLAGKLSGSGTGTIVFRDVNDTVDRVVATVDNLGNRITVTLDPN